MVLIILSIAALSFAQETTVSKQAWIKHYQERLPSAFCEEKLFFRQCYKVSKSECLQVASSSAKSCLASKQDQIPGVLQPKDGDHWGGIVAECMWYAYQTALQKKRISNVKCDDSNNW